MRPISHGFVAACLPKAGRLFTLRPLGRRAAGPAPPSLQSQASFLPSDVPQKGRARASARTVGRPDPARAPYPARALTNHGTIGRIRPQPCCLRAPRGSCLAHGCQPSCPAARTRWPFAYSDMVTSRILRISLKTNDGCASYSDMNRGEGCARAAKPAARSAPRTNQIVDAAD